MFKIKKTNCPYKVLPDTSYWRKSIEKVQRSDVDPIIKAPFKITNKDKIATAGSCFAQHIARYLRNSGFNYFVPEAAPEILSDSVAKKFNYGTFSCRYGNIYTTRQLLQLFDRAYGKFEPKENFWIEEDGSIIDPLRPNIQPGGFTSKSEYYIDREQHFDAVRKMFEELDIFVFTLGLTECYIDKRDGTAFPICPGCGVGTFNPARFEFHNEDIFEVMQNMENFVERLKSVNDKARIILTVSPVPLIATMEKKHVLSSTTYSKSVLRVAAEMLEKKYNHITYFPSYEIITGNFNRGSYYDEDLRSIKDEGVAHVMSVFMKHFTSLNTNNDGNSDKNLTPKIVVDTTKSVADDADIVCDEEFMLTTADK